MNIAPEKQDIDKLFSGIVYHIDFYQRDYKWDSEPVKRLLDDIFFKFNEQYDSPEYEEEEDKPSKEMIDRYAWYYLNTYVTNTIAGKVYVIDGQQRLTTLTLILIALKRMAEKCESKADGWIGSKIAGQSGFDSTLWMNHKKHSKTLKDLFKEEKDIDTKIGITSVNMEKNFKIIRLRLKNELGSSKHRFETFVFYFLHRLVLVKLSLEQADAPMVFEVINDRGIRLKPYQVLKGKLLGQIDKEELDRYNNLWETQVSKVNKFKEDEIDTFFGYYLMARYANTSNDATRLFGPYQRKIFLAEVEQRTGLKLKNNAEGVKNFLDNEFTYYTDLYVKLLDAYEDERRAYPSVYLNRLNKNDQLFMLILSSVRYEDEEEEEKIDTIARELDRLYSLLQLQNAYKKSGYYVSLISKELRDQPLFKIRPIFDKYLETKLKEKRNIDTKMAFKYASFEDTGMGLDEKFTRYFFARIEKFLAEHMGLPMKYSLSEMMSGGAKNGFGIERILSPNKENTQLFAGEGAFEQQSNRLGALLLLRKENIASWADAPYADKLKSYTDTLYWNETLREGLPERDQLKEKFDLEITPLSHFGPDQVEERQKILFEIAKKIWE